MSENSEARTQHFETHCLAWAALRHFLSAGLLREFSHALVRVVGGDQVKLDQLFEEELIAGTDGLESWAVRPREVETPVERYLQSRIRYLVWENDGEVFYERNQPHPAEFISPANVEDAIRVGQSDLFALEQIAVRLKVPPGTSFETLVAAIGKAGRLRETYSERAISEIVELCNAIDMPLAAVMTKHLGDLCVDADEWEIAAQFYQASSSRLSQEVAKEWSKFIELLNGIVTQSIASAFRATKGPAFAASYLAPKIRGSALSKSTLFVLNASFDSFVAESLSAEAFQFPLDRRASLLNEPLLLQARNSSSALEASVEASDQRGFETARERFWGLLRRQIALGSANETRGTQAHYANSVFLSLEKAFDREVLRELFIMALRLLVQSGQRDAARRIPWSERLVRAYVDEEIVTQLLSQANALEASREERLSVAVELLRGWCLKLAAEQSELAKRMLSFIAKLTASHESSSSNRRGLGGRSIVALREIAEQRPEFRATIGVDIVPAILTKLGDKGAWTDIAEGCKAAARYLDVLAPLDARRVVVAVLDLLDRADPENAAWVIVQPAIDVLVEPSAQRLAKQDKELDARIVSTILRFGLNQETEYTRLLYYLYRFDLRSVYEEPTRRQLTEVVKAVRTQALRITASNAIDGVCALLLASSAAGPDGVKDALKALEEALKTAFGESRRVALAFPYAYHAFNILAQRQEQIAADISIDLKELRLSLHSLLDQIVAVWSQAVRNPGIFAQFSLPPRTTPDPVIVHNWAFGSMALAQSLSEKSRVLEALDYAAKQQPLLSESIALARAVRLGPGEWEGLTPAAIGSDNARNFYSALGQRLVSLQYLDSVAREAVIDALLAQSLRLGPDGLDAAVLMVAGNQRLAGLRGTPEYQNYLKRVENNRNLRLALMPLLSAERPSD
ncbi:hypothetical protein U7859_02300 [Bradyrhizobium ottawaense]|uniref:hypothetical protein n=1 Tax=Bradyrhizobium ottawaense TaxID=931866 RepID=UPI002ADFF8C2|nr:hypothetical protein [Bradyrhizobium ottawaense]WQN83335.1 hypothetical protein U7859_02300 [Bradyrhizobium ottawaense]